MADHFVITDCPHEPPELIGAWTARLEEIRFSNGEFVMYCMDVYFPVPFKADPIHVRSFHRRTIDLCIEAFGEWLDSMLESDTIDP